MSVNAFKRLMESSKKSQSSQKRVKSDEVLKDCKSSATASGKQHQFWKNGLNAAMNDVQNVVTSSDNLVIIKDKYPKVQDILLMSQFITSVFFNSLQSYKLNYFLVFRQNFTIWYYLKL